MRCDLSVEIAGLHFKNPILTASGTFGYGLEFAEWFDLGRLGGICTKGLSLEPLEGNPPPRIVETHGGMLNAIGLQNIGVRAFIAEKLPRLRQFQTLIIANVFGSSFEEYLDVIRLLNDAEGIAAYELNISCPNVKAGGMEFGNDPDEAARLTEACKRIARRPLIVKLSPNAGDIVRVARAVESAGADAVSAINTILGLSVDIHTRRPRLATGMGGLSGPAIKPIALRMVYQIARAIRIPVIGIGGIATVEDALEFLIAGATAVQIGTANYYDPLVSIKIVEDLESFCQRHGITAIRSLIGSLQMPPS
ncbi:Dihydroorotate dehydrogenase B (NAD(+)), catalytic subunit [bacterium HR08]|nr:Dihydroorotate dehydrogenase B (NAD(+)), catalytic subunit [bacterium HR08]